MFSNKFKGVDNIYDIMAIAYSKILPYNGDKIAQFYNPMNYNDIYKVLNIHFERLDMECRFNIKELQNDLNEIIMQRNSDELYYVYYSIIMAIDQNIIYKLKESEFGDIFNNYESINKNSSIGVYVYVKINNSIINKIDENILKYEMKNGSETHKTGLRPRYQYNPNSINCNLDNYIILDKSDIGDYEICIHELIDYDKLSDRVNSSGNVRIGIIPFIDHNIESMLKVESKENAFWINGVQEEYKNTFIERFKANIDLLFNENLDFIIFPEMMLINEVVEIIGKYIEDLQHTNTKIILLGSIYENYSNTCNVYDNFGDLIFKQHKKTSFMYEKKYRELLTNSDKKIHVIDIHGVGRIFTFICRDLSNSDLMAIPKQLGADIILFPAFSESLDMENFSNSFSAQNNCINVFANSCAAFGEKDGRVSTEMKKNDKPIGYATIPVKKDRKSNGMTKFYNFSSKCIDCCNICYPKILSINTENIIFKDNTYSCEMEYSEII